MEGNGCLVVLSLLCLLQVQQGGGKQGVVDEMFHVVLLTLLLGFGAHLVGHVLPGAERGEASHEQDRRVGFLKR